MCDNHRLENTQFREHTNTVVKAAKPGRLVSQIFFFQFVLEIFKQRLFHNSYFVRHALSSTVPWHKKWNSLYPPRYPSLTWQSQKEAKDREKRERKGKSLKFIWGQEACDRSKQALVFCLFEIEPCCIALPVLEFIISSCLSLLNTGIRGIWPHAWLCLTF